MRKVIARNDEHSISLVKVVEKHYYPVKETKTYYAMHYEKDNIIMRIESDNEEYCMMVFNNSIDTLDLMKK